MPLSLGDFLNKYLGKTVSGYSQSGGQCGDLARTRVKDLTGNPYHGLPPTGDAGVRQFWFKADPAKWRKVAFESGRVPPPGALVIFDVGKYGHVAIALPGSSTDSCRTFDQNWSKPRVCTKETHRYTAHGALGWLVLQGETVQVGPSMVQFAFQVAYLKPYWHSPAFYLKVREKLRVACKDFIATYGYDPREAPAFFRKFLNNQGIP